MGGEVDALCKLGRACVAGASLLQARMVSDVTFKAEAARQNSQLDVEIERKENSRHQAVEGQAPNQLGAGFGYTAGQSSANIMNHAYTGSSIFYNASSSSSSSSFNGTVGASSSLTTFLGTFLFGAGGAVSGSSAGLNGAFNGVVTTTTTTMV